MMWAKLLPKETLWPKAQLSIKIAASAVKSAFSSAQKFFAWKVTKTAAMATITNPLSTIRLERQ